MLRAQAGEVAAPHARCTLRGASRSTSETLWAGIGDSLYGFRIYPVAPLAAIMRRQPWMRGFDFDPEAAVRPCGCAGPVCYFGRHEGGVSHFHYGRDNALLAWMHLRLFTGFAMRLPMLVARRLTRRRDQTA